MNLKTLPPGTELGCSDWLTIDQPLIDRFADLTRDWQDIHVDPVRAAASPLGGTVAHGFLTLSLASHFLAQAVPALGEGVREGLNYGFDRLRFVAPVKAGARVRGRFRLTGIEPRGPGWRLLRLGLTVEIAQGARPAVVADWLVLQRLETASPHLE